MFSLFAFLFVNLIIFFIYRVLFLHNPKPTKLKRTCAEIVIHENSGKFFYPIVEFSYNDKLIRCRAERLKYEHKPYVFIGKNVEISYCENSINSDFNKWFNSKSPTRSFNTIVTLEDYTIKEILKKKEKHLKLFFILFLTLSVSLTIFYIFLEFIL